MYKTKEMHAYLFTAVLLSIMDENSTQLNY